MNNSRHCNTLSKRDYKLERLICFFNVIDYVSRLICITFVAPDRVMKIIKFWFYLKVLGLFTERIACILYMHLGACRFFTHPTALMHLKSIFSNCIQLHFIFLAHTRMGSLLLLLLKKVSSARLGESDINPISPKTPAPQYQPMDRKKRKGKRVEDYSRDRAA